MSRALVIKGANFESNRVAHVTFSGIPCTGIVFDDSEYSPTSTTVGTEISVTKTPVDTTDEVTFSVADTSVARVLDGKVYAVGFGTTTITATCGSATATASVAVASIEVETIKLPGNISAVTSWGEENPLKYTASSYYDGFAVGKTTPASTPDAITGIADTAVIVMPSGTTKIKIESTDSNWQINLRYTTTNSTLHYGDSYYAKYLESASKATSGYYVEVTDMPASADSFAFARAHVDSDYTMKVTFTAA